MNILSYKKCIYTLLFTSKYTYIFVFFCYISMNFLYIHFAFKHFNDAFQFINPVNLAKTKKMIWGLH